MIIIDIFVIVKVKKNRAQQRKIASKKLKQLKIFHIATNNLLAALQIRGGEDIILQFLEIAYPDCIVGDGLRYVNNDRLRKLVTALFKDKIKNKVVFITKTALCHLAKTYGVRYLPALPVPIVNFIGKLN